MTKPPTTSTAPTAPTGSHHPAPEAPCPCGAGRFGACCGPYLQGHSFPTDAATLMRSRYSAYVLGDTSYLLETWHASTRPGSLAASEPGLRWLGLEIKRSWVTAEDRAEVEFVARSKLGGRAHRLHERSRFLREAGRWRYVDGDLDPTPS